MKKGNSRPPTSGRGLRNLAFLTLLSLSGCGGGGSGESPPQPPACSSQGIASLDLSGNPRACPQATMGALEAVGE
jgi:hypothetical protein